MSYLALARKWRPAGFESLVGQDHVVTALKNALDTGRLHHAWLFTGTRGVGKTTLSRILAKALNCEKGITSHPCEGEDACEACRAITEDRFVDYVEFDAASNRGVDEMSKMLDNAVYPPVSGRFKICMIDEVHMLSGTAYNAMLKTLEEPPPHMKFILATTDPQKIPATVRSRCLQFNLKQMPPETIVPRLADILQKEAIGYSEAALQVLARAANGSMRDALSLTDQAIAYGAGNVDEDVVRGMLGTIDQRYLVGFLDSLVAASPDGVMKTAAELQMRSLPYGNALADLAYLLSQIAVAQKMPSLVETDPMAEDILRLAGLMHPDFVQLCYSIAVHARKELALSPDEYAGFVMAGLRMLSLADKGAISPDLK